MSWSLLFIGLTPKKTELLELYSRLPQTFKIYFGGMFLLPIALLKSNIYIKGAHDNGYHGSLSAMQTMGLKEKLVILQSYTQIAREIATLKYRSLEIPGLFMTDKLDRSPTHRRNRSHSEVPLKLFEQPQSEDQPFPSASFNASPKKKLRQRNKKRESILTLVSVDDFEAVSKLKILYY